MKKRLLFWVAIVAFLQTSFTVSAQCGAGEDTTPPTAICKNITIQLDETGNANIIVSDIDDGSTDNCSILRSRVVPSSFDCTNLGDNEVTLIIQDEELNTGQCTAIVTVQDTIDPSPLCENITVELDENGEAMITAQDVAGSSVDNCEITVFRTRTTTFDCNDLGDNDVSINMLDASFNSANCTGVVTIVDNIPPTVVCKDITVQLDETGEATITTADIDDGSSDNCTIVDLSLSKTEFTCADIGTNTVTLTALDLSNNQESCEAIVTVVAATPTAICNTVILELDASGNATLTAADLNGGSDDPCSSLSFSASQTTFDCTNLGNNTVVLTVTNQNGLQDTCNAIVTVEDVTDPNAVCQNITIQFDAAGNDIIITPNDIDNGSSDNCGDIDLFIDPGDATFTTVDVGTTRIVELIVDDPSSFLDTCNAQVSVVAYASPTISCPADITVSNDAGACEGAVTLATPTFTGTVDQTLIPTSPRTDLLGGGNPISPTLIDTQVVLSNVITATEDVILEIELRGDFDTVGECFVLAGPDGSEVYNECMISGSLNGVTETATITQATWNNWVTTYGSDLTFTLQEDADVGVNNSYYQLKAANLGNLLLVNDFNRGSDASDTYPVGQTTINWTVTDRDGGSDTCAQLVTVNDTELPVVSCQNITVQLDALGNATIVASDIDNGSTDNCGIASLSIDIDTFTCGDLGDNQVTLTVTDSNTNVNRRMATVTVTETIDPVLSYTGVQGLGTQDNPFTSLTSPDLLAAPSGVYYFNFSGSTFQGQVDNDTDGGGWLMVLNYVHQAGTNPDLQIRNTDLPLLGSSTLGTDESTTAFWGHFGNTLAADIDFSEVRFYGESSSHSNILNFKTTQQDALDYIKTGTGSFDMMLSNQDFTLLAGHTTTIPENGDDYNSDAGDLALTESPIINTEDDQSWSIRANNEVWAMDDAPVSFENNTLHRIWVRGDLSPVNSTVVPEITFQLDAVGTITINPADIPITATDNCGTPALSLSQTDFDMSDVGLNVIQFTATDSSGNQAVVDVNVTIEAPTLGIEGQVFTNTTLYPVPARDYIKINGLRENVNLTIYDITGKKVYQQKEVTNHQEIPISQLFSGTYLVKLETDKNTLVKRIVIQ
ncbi:T9SS type A sorting domain-containing protein [Aquimarina sp. MMG016]|uniref:T9SS type A sorting domain-containing protein n=1 Tax=Aquimarina sp. MMG016 TaxID=2822690 RepID=UPI001B3A01AE|nr:T9SS type A sorting domain-containing protein [Aquimarina sp. MMG016]MBQ4820680.1 T9SS type A sorting domain-containing protein [Aquimarina sp. MMG016]